MIELSKAQKIVLSKLKKIKQIEKINIKDALDRVLAEDIYTKENIPQFDNSAMDGFAVKYEDVKSADKENPVILKITGEVKAGDNYKRKLKNGECISIMTGAKIPQGTTAIVIKEVTERQGDIVKIYKSIRKKENIRYAGEDIKKGELILRKGVYITPAMIGMLARTGNTEIKVKKRPKIGILATGSELVPASKNKLPAGKIRNSNNYSLYAMLKIAGADPVDLGIVKDDPIILKKRLKTLKGLNALITTGGVSMGDYDFVKQVLKEIGFKMHLWKVAMKPGKPFVFGNLKDMAVFGLPGNPASSMVSFEMFVRPSIKKMFGLKEVFLKKIYAKLDSDINGSRDRINLIRVKLEMNRKTPLAKVTGFQGSGRLMSMVDADGLAVVPIGNKTYKKGTITEILLFD